MRRRPDTTARVRALRHYPLRHLERPPEPTPEDRILDAIEGLPTGRAFDALNNAGRELERRILWGTDEPRLREGGPWPTSNASATR
jgi:hypothetical protein